MPGNPETVTATGNFDIEAVFDLPQMFIKLTAKIGKAVVIGRLENYVPRNLDSVQNLYLYPLRRELPVRTTNEKSINKTNASMSDNFMVFSLIMFNNFLLSFGNWNCIILIKQIEILSEESRARVP